MVGLLKSALCRTFWVSILVYGLGTALVAALLFPSTSLAQNKPVPIKPPGAVSAPAPVPAKAAPKRSTVPKKTQPPPSTNADPAILFEGYSKVLLGGVHIGFAVSRYEFDQKKNEFISTYFLKTNALGGNVTESLNARATSGFKPISYQYTSIVDGKTKTIDAAFKGEQMNAVVTENGKPTQVRKTIPKGAFPSTFLGYMMLKGKEGIKPGVRYAFVAIAEEDAAVYPGEASVVGQETQNGLPAFKVFNTFKGVRFASWVTIKGDVLATRSNTQGLATELVSSIQEATAGQSFNPSTLVALFKRLPEGKQNALARKETAPAPSPQPTPPQPTAPLTTEETSPTTAEPAKPALEASDPEPVTANAPKGPKDTGEQ